MTTESTLQETVEKVTAFINRPENKIRTNNGACRYVRPEDGQDVPNCVAGAVLHDVWAYPIEMLRSWDEGTVSSDSTIASLGRLGVFDDFDTEAVNFLDDLQYEADRGHDWGHALLLALEKNRLEALDGD